MFIYIVEPDPVVLMDLEGMILAQYSDSTILSEPGFNAAIYSVHEMDLSRILVINGTLATETWVQQLAHGNFEDVAVVYIGRPANDTRFGVLVEQPFTQEMVLSAVAHAIST